MSKIKKSMMYLACVDYNCKKTNHNSCSNKLVTILDEKNSDNQFLVAEILRFNSEKDFKKIAGKNKDLYISLKAKYLPEDYKNKKYYLHPAKIQLMNEQLFLQNNNISAVEVNFDLEKIKKSTKKLLKYNEGLNLLSDTLNSLKLKGIIDRLKSDSSFKRFFVTQPSTQSQENLNKIEENTYFELETETNRLINEGELLYYNLLNSQPSKSFSRESMNDNLQEKKQSFNKNLGVEVLDENYPDFKNNFTVSQLLESSVAKTIRTGSPFDAQPTEVENTFARKMEDEIYAARFDATKEKRRK